MRIRHIEVFKAVMLTGTVTGAARLLNVTQPAASRTIAHAELQLGVKLFHRVRNRLVPTDEAVALYPHVEKLFADLDAVQRFAGNLRANPDAKEIRVVSILALGPEVLPRALKVFRLKFPEVQVTFQALHTPQIVSALVLQEADVGFLFSAPPHPALLREVLAEAELVCVAARGQLPRKNVKKGSIALTELATVPVVGLDMTDPLGGMLAQACKDAGAGLDSKVSVQTYHGALALARHGHGAAIVDGCTAMSAVRNEVDVLPLEPRIAVPVHALLPASKPASVVVRAFMRAVQQVLADAAGHVSPA
jgi:DNA-binding transcriptional LysR family regulator